MALETRGRPDTHAVRMQRSGDDSRGALTEEPIGAAPEESGSTPLESKDGVIDVVVEGASMRFGPTGEKHHRIWPRAAGYERSRRLHVSRPILAK